MRCQPANAGPRKTPHSVSLPLSLSLRVSLSPFPPSFAAHSVSVPLTDIFSVFLSFVRRARARAGVHAHSLSLSFLVRHVAASLARQNPQNIRTASRGLSASFSGRARERAMRSAFSTREKERSEKERRREKERTQSRRVYARSLLAVIHAPDASRNSRSTKEI